MDNNQSQKKKKKKNCFISMFENDVSKLTETSDLINFLGKTVVLSRTEEQVFSLNVF